MYFTETFISSYDVSLQTINDYDSLKTIPYIKLFGTETCHKTRYYQDFLEARGFSYQFFDVYKNEAHAEMLRNLYENRKLNFPTITIGEKKLRNPPIKKLEKWLI